MRNTLLAGLLALGACSAHSPATTVPASPAPTVVAAPSNVVVLAVDAFACYEAVKSATSAANTAANVSAAAAVIASNSSCTPLTAEVQALVAKALAGQLPVSPAS